MESSFAMPDDPLSSLKEEALAPKSPIERDKRLETLNLVSLTHRDKEGRVDLEIVGRTLDLSEGGIFLEIPQPAPSGTGEVGITLGIREHVFDARGEIVHRRELASGNVGLGISFKELSPECLAFIRDFLRESGEE